MVPVRRERGRYVVDETDLGKVEAYFRTHPSRPYRKGTAALDRARKG
jgi:hypothetical protein